MMKKIKSFANHLKKSLVISWKSSPYMFLLRIAYELYGVFSTIVSSTIIKKVINTLSDNPTIEKITYYVLALIFLQLLSAAFARIIKYINTVHTEKIATYIKIEIIEKINSLDMSYFDNPDFYNEIQNANRDSKSLQSLTWIILSILRGVIQVLICGYILGGLAAYLPFLIFALNVPSVLIDKYLTKKKYTWQLSQTENERRFGYVEGILQNRIYAKDVRVYHTQNYFLDKFYALWSKWFKEKNKIEREKYFYAFLAGILPILSDVGILFYVCVCIINGTLTLGDFTYYRSMSSQFRSGLNSVLMSFNSGYESEMKLSHYTDFLKWTSLLNKSGSRELQKIQTVEFCNVSFKYPNTDIDILNNVSFKIGENEKIALVGANGSGKSTLVKLLLRLYDPTEGEILINGINIKEYDLKSLHDCFGVVFQDFNRYYLPIKEVVAMAQLEDQENTTKLAQACENADIDLHTHFSNGAETILGKIFDKNGVVLSGGQWQKVAIAQAYFKDSSFIIMDEPNASLDPDSENRMFTKLQDLCQDKAGLVITHRLSSVFIADKIVVLDKGCIEEIGTHEELMCNEKLYKKMFELQAEKYQIK